jgi:peptide deformylase
MALIPLIFAPHPIFKKHAKIVTDFNNDLRQLIKDMFETMYAHQAVGIGANMVGILKQIAIVDLQENGIKTPYHFINPKITYQSEETQRFTEGSLCFPGIDAEIERPAKITMSYQDEFGTKHTIKAEGWLATVIQHEIDYLNGKIFLDYLPKLKRRMLLNKLKKTVKKRS